jgi:hypothetical protein
MKNFKVLDVFFYRGYAFTSKVVRFLTSVRYGIPYKDTYSHIALGYDDNSTISAEASGTKLMPNSEIETTLKSDVIIYRFKNVSLGKIEEFYNVAPQYIGRGYAYARYLMDAGKIFTFVTFILTAMFGWINFKVFLTFAAFIALIQLATIILRKIDKKTSDCAELSAIILSQLKMMPHFSSQPRNEFPNSQLSKMVMMEWYGLVDMIGIWDYKSKTWKEVSHDRSIARNFPFANNR